MNLNIGDKVKFVYLTGRDVIGTVIRDDAKSFVLMLHTDYIGRNEEWFSGELKSFMKRHIKTGIKILKKA